MTNKNIFGDPLENVQKTNISMPKFIENKPAISPFDKTAAVDRARRLALDDRDPARIPRKKPEMSRVAEESLGWPEMTIKQKAMRVGLAAAIAAAVVIPGAIWMSESQKSVDATREQMEQERENREDEAAQLERDIAAANEAYRDSPEGQAEEAIRRSQQELIDRNGAY